MIDCRNITPKEAYKNIKEIATSPSPSFELSEAQHNTLITDLRNRLLAAEKAKQILQRAYITMSVITGYLAKQQGLDSEKLFYLVQLILTRFNTEKRIYGENHIKLSLTDNAKLLETFGPVNNKQISIYQTAIDRLVPKIQQAFEKQKLNDPTVKDFLFPSQAAKSSNLAELCQHYGFYAIAGAAAIVAGITYYVAANEGHSLNFGD